MPFKPTFKVGEIILAKWPGSQLYYDAEVTSTSTDHVHVRFMEGSEEKVAFKHVTAKPETNKESKKSSRAKSPARKNSPGRPRSTAKSSSPGRPRSTAKSGSPGRPRSSTRNRSKSPSAPRRTRSRSRSRQLKAEPKSKSISPERQDVDIEEEMSKGENSVRSRRLTPTRSSSRIAALTKKISEEVVSEEANSKPKKILDMPDGIKEKPAAHKKKSFFYHLLQHLMIFFMPCFMYLLYLSCTKRHCSLTTIPKIPKALSTYFNLEAFGVYCAWILCLAALTAIPVGKVQSASHGGRTYFYRCNGHFVLVASMMCVAVFHFYGFSSTYVHKKFFKLLTASFISSFMFALFVYVKSFWAKDPKLNADGNTGCWPTDFFIGREANPRLWQTCDVKMFSFRCGMISLILVLSSLLVQEYSVHPNDMNPSLVVSCALQIIYLTWILFQEESLLTISGLREPIGFQTIITLFSAFPFSLSLGAVYMSRYRPVVPSWFLACDVLVFLIGFFILCMSNLQKHRFRTNPYDPRIAHLETIPTTQGKKLLVAGWWGWVCHPNYLGDIIANFAITLPAGFSHGFPQLIPIMMALGLIFRAYNDDLACKKKYGSAWEQYRERVKYRLIPYIY